MSSVRGARRARAVTAVACALTACAAAAAPAAAQQPAPAPAPNTLTVIGTGEVKPAPANPRSNASIAKAVKVAREAAIPAAINDGRGHAVRLARALNVRLIALIAVSEVVPQASPYGFSPYGEDGTFGPGRYCATLRLAIFRTVNGKRKRVGFRTRRLCRVPPEVTSSLTMVFSTG